MLKSDLVKMVGICKNYSFLLLLLMKCAFYATSEKLYVGTDEKATGLCQDRSPCCTLSEYASNSSHYFNYSNTELIFLPGIHYLKESSINFKHLKNICLKADDGSAEILCVQEANHDIKQYSGFSFQNITNLEIKGLIFTGCSIIEETSISYFSHVSTGLYMREITNLTIDKVTIQNSTGYGLFLSQIYGISSIRNSIFQHNKALHNNMNGGNVVLIYQTPQTLSVSTSLTIQRSKFLQGKSFTLASGLLVMLFCSGVKIRIIEAELRGNRAEPTVNNNHVMQPSLGGNLGFLLRDYDSLRSICTAGSNSTEITLQNTTISSGLACYGGGMFVNLTSSSRTENGGSINFSMHDSVFTKNSALTDGGAVFLQMNFQARPKHKSHIFIKNCTVANNSLLRNSLSGVAVAVTSSAIGKHHVSPILTLMECVFSNNHVKTEDVNEDIPKYAAVVLVSQCMHGLHVENGTRFDSNAVGAISLIHSSLTVSGEVVITNNTGYIGGGLALREVSYLIFTAETNLTISYNHASYEGGGIFVQDEPLMLQNQPCFYQTDFNTSLQSVKIMLINNSAAYGSQLYGGRIETCIVENAGSCNFSDIFELVSTDDNGSSISSEPEKICFCYNDTPNFNSRNKSLGHPVYSGESFNVSIAFVGQLKSITHGENYFPLIWQARSKISHTKIKPPRQVTNKSRKGEACTNYSIQVFTALLKVKYDCHTKNGMIHLFTLSILFCSM